MDIDTVVEALQAVAPLDLAAPWDNVGLLVRGTRPVARVALCIDLTEAVLDEAIAHGADLVLAYHPPLFKGLVRLVGQTPTERVVARCVREGLSVYSPHTALDAVGGGLNDWLLEAFGEVQGVRPIEAAAQQPDVGAGRLAQLVRPCSLDQAVALVKRHLRLDHVRVAAPAEVLDGRRLTSLAVCPGAGGSLFEAVPHADLFLTGEMRHHDVLARVGAGSAVLLTDHTHSERGYLARLAERLETALPGVGVHQLALDEDPLVVR